MGLVDERTVKENQKKKHGKTKERTQLSSVVRSTNGEKMSAAAEVRTAGGQGSALKLCVRGGVQGSRGSRSTYRSRLAFARRGVS